jgi:Ca2+-binding EF-hand superfamily protein
LIDENEARHCINQYISGYSGKQIVPDARFLKWFRQLDKDGDGKIDMIEFAHGM